MSQSNENTSLVAALGAATVSLVLSLAVTSTIALGFITGHTSDPVGSVTGNTQVAHSQVRGATPATVVDTAARS